MTAHTESGGRSQTARLTLPMMREKGVRPDISLCDETEGVFFGQFLLLKAATASSDDAEGMEGVKQPSWK